jgi:hypothetical protein
MLSSFALASLLKSRQASCLSGIEENAAPKDFAAARLIYTSFSLVKVCKISHTCFFVHLVHL